MSQRVTPSVPILNTREQFSTIRTVTAIKGFSDFTSDCCFCVPNCDWTMPAFADLSDPTNKATNDIKDFIITAPKGGSVTGTLIKIAPDGTETPTVIVDDTYGDFFPLNNIKLNVWGMLLDWQVVASTLGFGKYKFNILVKNVATTEVFNEDSVCFKLMPYTCGSAHRTIRVETLQNGYFEGGFDYTDVVLGATDITGGVTYGWIQQCRLYGRFHREGRELTVDNIVTEDRGQEQVQAQTVKKYNLQLDTIPTELSNRLIDDMLLAPEIKINDYNINNIELYRDVRVTLTDLPDPIITTMNVNEFYEIKFAEWLQNNVHRYR